MPDRRIGIPITFVGKEPIVHAYYLFGVSHRLGDRSRNVAAGEQEGVFVAVAGCEVGGEAVFRQIGRDSRADRDLMHKTIGEQYRRAADQGGRARVRPANPASAFIVGVSRCAGANRVRGGVISVRFRWRRRR